MKLAFWRLPPESGIGCFILAGPTRNSFRCEDSGPERHDQADYQKSGFTVKIVVIDC